MLVGAVVVEHHMELSARVGAGDELEEGQELGVSMPVKAAAGDLAGGDLQGGEQAGDAVPDIIVGAPLGQPRAQRQGWRGAVQRLDLGLLVHTEHDRAGRRFQVQGTQVGDLGQQLGIGGELERLDAVRGKVVVGPDPSDRHAADLEVAGQGPGRPVRDTEVGGRPGQGDGDDLGPASLVDDAGSARAGLVVQPAQTLAGIAARQRTTAWREQPTWAAIRVLVWPSAASSTIRARMASPAGTDVERAQRPSVTASGSETVR
jgi:hypothetical protein